MTNEERKKLIEDMVLACAHFTPYWASGMSAALAIAERRIREDCAEIARQHESLEIQRFYSKRARDITAAILASIPEP